MYIVGFKRNHRKVYIPYVLHNGRKRVLRKDRWTRASDAEHYSVNVMSRYYRAKNAARSLSDSH